MSVPLYHPTSGLPVYGPDGLPLRGVPNECCYRQARRCSDDALLDLWVPRGDVDPAKAYKATVGGVETCVHFPDLPTVCKGTIHGGALTEYADCAACAGPGYSGDCCAQYLVTIAGFADNPDPDYGGPLSGVNGSYVVTGGATIDAFGMSGDYHYDDVTDPPANGQIDLSLYAEDARWRASFTYWYRVGQPAGAAEYYGEFSAAQNSEDPPPVGIPPHCPHEAGVYSDGLGHTMTVESLCDEDLP